VFKIVNLPLPRHYLDGPITLDELVTACCG